MDLVALFPQRSDAPLDPLEAVGAEHRPKRSDRPWVLANMIASADGATAVDGLSGPLGGPADFAMFVALRSIADAIVVGATTVRQEDYRPPGVGSEAAAKARAGRGQRPRPSMVIVTSKLSVEPDQRLFADTGYRPLVATTERAPADRRAALAEVAEIIVCGEDRVDLGRLLDRLHDRGIERILSEGGPSLNGQLIADGLIDEWNLTISPILATGSSARAAHGPPLPHPVEPMALSRVWQADELLFCRWIRAEYHQAQSNEP